MTFLVIGCPRSGTMYMSALFAHFGFDVPHETSIGANGIVSWVCAVKGQGTPWIKQVARTQEMVFDRTIHVVRDPRHSISSIAAAWGVGGSFFHHVVKRWLIVAGSRIEQAAAAWVGWNSICRVQSDISIQVEKAADVLPEFLSSVGCDVVQRGDLPSTTTNSKQDRRPSAPLTDEELRVLGVYSHAKLYGYTDNAQH